MRKTTYMVLTSTINAQEVKPILLFRSILLQNIVEQLFIWICLNFQRKKWEIQFLVNIRVIKMIPVFKMGNKYKTQEEKK